MCKPQDGRRDKNRNSTCGSRYFDHYSELCVGLTQTWASIIWSVQHRLDGVCRKCVICTYLNGTQYFDHYSELCGINPDTVQHRLDGPALFGRCVQEVCYLSLSKRRPPTPLCTFTSCNDRCPFGFLQLTRRRFHKTHSASNELAMKSIIF